MQPGKWTARVFFQWFGIALIALMPLSSVFAQYTEEDSLLASQILEQYEKDSRMPVSGISVVVLKGIVRLKGVVSTLAQKHWAEEIAYSVPGVRAVDNQLWVDRPRISDAKLKQQIEKKLRSNPDSLFTRVEVQVVDGEVRLKGTVSSWGAKYTANDILSMIPGVQKIKNDLKIRDLRNRTDDQIRRAVIKAIREKIATSSEYWIKVKVVRGVVTLRGRVRTENEKRIAIQTALFVPGVADLVDKLEVLPE